MRKTQGYALCWTMLFVCMTSTLLGTAMAHVVYLSKAAGVSLVRAQARSDLLSLTNSALKWLRTDINRRAGTITSDEYPTISEDLSIFSLEDPQIGSVKVFHLGYDPANLMKSPNNPLFFPPYRPGAYLVRAVVEKQGLASITNESVYVLTSNDVPDKGVIDVLDEEPLFSREVFR
ncbi:MAG: hypothetical protein LBR71_07315 [Synergistaceae bacterium]|jgi:hypothetical protein|nr:hypothetical protein [Synergistaceae bacterium]